MLRVLIDEDLPEARPNGRFLILGSASLDLLEAQTHSNWGSLWTRGGFPNSFLAATDTKSLTWRRNLLRTYLERDIPQLGPRIASLTLRRFFTMLAHSQGGQLNAADLARSLAVDGKTVARYLDLFQSLLLVRLLPPYHANTAKRLVKGPKIYIRDSGLVHCLLNLQDSDSVLSHPVSGRSWEGFVIENLVSRAPDSVTPYFFRTAAGAEVDLLLTMPGGKLWAIEIKRGLAPKLDKGFHHALEDLQPDRSFVVYSGADRYRKTQDIEAISLVDMMRELSQA